MLRCRPSEITLAPSDIAYCKHRYALQQAARKDRSVKPTDIQASTSPRIRRGPQRSRDDAVIHPHGRLAQRNKAEPSQLRSNNPVDNMDGTGEMCSFAISSAASIEESSVEESCSGQFVMKYDGTAEVRHGKSLRTTKGYSCALANSDLRDHIFDQSIAEENDDNNTLGLSLLSTKGRSPKSVDEKVIEKEDKFKHHDLYPDHALRQISAELPDDAVCSPRPIMTRARSIKHNPDDFLKAKRTLSPQINLNRRSREMNDPRNPRTGKGFHREYEQSMLYDTNIDAYGQVQPTKTRAHPPLIPTRKDFEGSYECGRDDRIHVNRRRSHRLPSLNKNDFLSYSAQDLAILGPRQRRTTSFKFHDNLGNFFDSAAYGSGMLQEKTIIQSHRSNPSTSYQKKCPFSSSSSRHSSYASMSQIHGPPQNIPARRSSLETTNVLNVSCYGRSCSCSSPGPVGANNDIYPPTPKSPKANKSQLRYRERERECLPSAKNWAGFATRSSSLSEAAPETVIHECSPLEQIQHYYTRIYRGRNDFMSSRWRISISEPDQNLLRSDRHDQEPQRLFSNPLDALGAFASEERKEAIFNNDTEYLFSPSELSVSGGRAQNAEESKGNGSNYEEILVSEKVPASHKLCRPTSTKETSFPSQRQAQDQCSYSGQHISYQTPSSLPAEPSANLVRNDVILQVADTEADTEAETEHDPPTQISKGNTAHSSNSEINVSRFSLSTNATDDDHRVNSISTDGNTSRAIQSLPWHLSDANLQQENRGDEDEQQMRVALQRLQLRTAGNDHGERMDETPPREGRIERFLRA